MIMKINTYRLVTTFDMSTDNYINTLKDISMNYSFDIRALQSQGIENAERKKYRIDIEYDKEDRPKNITIHRIINTVKEELDQLPNGAKIQLKDKDQIYVIGRDYSMNIRLITKNYIVIDPSKILKTDECYDDQFEIIRDSGE